MKHVMHDLETLGKRNNAIILSIGAVQFDETGIGLTFYTLIDPQSCIDAGLTIDVSTIMWWMKQSDQARQAFLGNMNTLKEALSMFSYWYPTGADLWGNGSMFDNTILNSAYVAVGMTPPWNYKQDRCYRTLKALYPDIKAEKVIGETQHNALDDALYQARHASRILAHIAGKNPPGELRKLS